MTAWLRAQIESATEIVLSSRNSATGIGALKDDDLLPQSQVLQLQPASGTLNSVPREERTTRSALDNCHLLKENKVPDRDGRLREKALE
jgi:hypothetical protein